MSIPVASGIPDSLSCTPGFCVEFLGGLRKFSFTLEVEIYFSSSNSFFDHVACGDFFLTNAFAFSQPPTLFPNGDIPKLKQLL